MTPIIGITACRKITDYVESIRRAGGEPRVLEIGADPPQRALAGVTGLVLTGGADVDPALYEQSRHASFEPAEEGRDRFETAVTTFALEHDYPLLAVCRGTQVLNVAFGGTLIQDIPSQVPGALNHCIESSPLAIAHEVWISDTSRLWELMHESLSEADACHVNSRHHQAVARVAQGFSVTATAPDGVIEAIERPDARFCVAVQWHPENFWRTGEFRPLFEGFIEACKDRPPRGG